VFKCAANIVQMKNRQQPLNTILPKNVGSHFQMDLIEMPFSQGYRYILRVVDHMSCFGYIAPIKLKEAKEIGRQVVKIISTSVAPQILQFDNGHEVSLFRLMYDIQNVTSFSVYCVTNDLCLYFLNINQLVYGKMP
jgi:hypothetical protein